jgi:PAS domain S-box-containing protein
MRLLLSRVTLNNMFQFCVLLDAQGAMWDMNHAALRGAGITRTDIHGKPFWEARWWQTSVETREQLKAAIGRAAHGEFVRYDVDIIGRASGSEVITIDFDIVPVKDRDGNVRFLICEGRDVTEQRRLERSCVSTRSPPRSCGVALKRSSIASATRSTRSIPNCGSSMSTGAWKS